VSEWESGVVSATTSLGAKSKQSGKALGALAAVYDMAALMRDRCGDVKEAAVPAHSFDSLVLTLLSLERSAIHSKEADRVIETFGKILGKNLFATNTERKYQELGIPGVIIHSPRQQHRALERRDSAAHLIGA
jgi:hypothetical protein